MIGVIVFAVIAGGYIVWLAKVKRFHLIEIEDGAIAPSSVSAYVGMLAAVVGGLWLVFSVGVSGGLELQRLSLELPRGKYLPIVEIDAAIEHLPRSEPEDMTRVAVRIVATARNIGPKDADLTVSKRPLLVLTRLGDSGATSFESLPYRKIDCDTPAQDTCKLETWNKAVLEPDGVMYFEFLHPGLEAGLYFAQFQIPVEESEIRPGFNAEKPVFWSRSIYFSVDPQTDRARQSVTR